MKRWIIGAILLGAYAVLGTTGVAPVPVLHDDLSTGAYTVPVFDTASGDLEEGQWAVLEDGKNIYVHKTDYFGAAREGEDFKGLIEAHLISHQDYGTYLDINSVSYIKPVTTTEAMAIYSGQKVINTRLELANTAPAEAAIANTGSKTYAGRNLITSSTTDVAITAGDMFVYGGFNNTNSLNSMSLACTSGTVVKANAGTVLSGAGNSHVWAVVGASAGTDTCTLTATSSAFFLVQESNYSGAQTDAALIIDAQTLNVTCTSTTSCTTSLNTVTANDWTVIFSANSSGAPGAGAATTLRVTDANGIGLADSNAAIVAPGSTSLIITRPGASGFAQNMIAIAPFAAAVITNGLFNEI